MYKIKVLFFCVMFICILIIVEIKSDDSKFRGAVVEYGAKYMKSSPKDTVMLNVENYRVIVERMKSLDAPPDIIVFPECGLISTTWFLKGKEFVYGEFIPDPNKEKVIPCESDDSEALKKLSCIARKNSVYIVVNTLEKAYKDNNTVLYYNTNVVFDRMGTLIARYRKFNIFAEDGKTESKPTHPDYTFFDTDFGVRFGTFTCFDIIFKTPALDLVRYYNVTHIAFPTAWYSELPFLTAVQEQSAWSYGSKAILLASGYNDPAMGNTGSGIYFRNGDHETFSERSMQVQTKEDFAIISWIPKSISNTETISTNTTVEFFNFTEMAELKLKTDKLQYHTTKPIAEPSKYEMVSGKNNQVIQTVNEVTETVCDRGLCCEFTFKKTTKYCVRVLDTSTSEESPSGDDFGLFRYRLNAFNGIRTYDYVTTGGVQICSITSCLDDNSVSTCGKRTDNSNFSPQVVNFSGVTYEQCKTSFDNVSIKAKLKSDVNNTFLTSNTLLSSSKLTLALTEVIKYGTVANPELFSITKITDIDETTALYELKSKGPLVNPLSINLYNRVFESDGLEMTTDKSNTSFNISITLLLVSFISFYIIYYQLIS